MKLAPLALCAIEEQDHSAIVLKALLLIFLFWVLPAMIMCGVLGWLTAAAAYARGRSRRKWFVFGFFFFPLALLFVLVMGTHAKGLEARLIKTRELRVCPTCAELVRFDALKCRYCLTDLPAVEEIAPPDVSPRALRERRERRTARTEGAT